MRDNITLKPCCYSESICLAVLEEHWCNASLMKRKNALCFTWAEQKRTTGLVEEHWCARGLQPTSCLSASLQEVTWWLYPAEWCRALIGLICEKHRISDEAGHSPASFLCFIYPKVTRMKEGCDDKILKYYYDSWLAFYILFWYFISFFFWRTVFFLLP